MSDVDQRRKMRVSLLFPDFDHLIHDFTRAIKLIRKIAMPIGSAASPNMKKTTGIGQCLTWIAPSSSIRKIIVPSGSAAVSTEARARACKSVKQASSNE
jgi:hypothetical protein